MLEAIRGRVEQAIEGRVFPGCVIGIVQTNGKRITLPFGSLTYEGKEKVEENTLYDLASITKSVPTALLVLTLVAEEKLFLDDLVKKYIPELQNDQDAAIEDLLRYRVQGPRLSMLRLKTFEEIRTHIFEQGLKRAEGNAFTNVPAFLLGIMLERVGGASLATLAHRYFFEPLDMNETTFFPHASICAPTEIDERGEVRGLPHDESAYAFAKARRSVGHAGLFSTAHDLLTFLEALLQNDGFTKPIIAGAEAGLGWQVDQSYFMGRHASPETFGKTGFTGTSICVDRARDVGFVILSNRTYPKRPTDAMSESSAINLFRSDIADIVFSEHN
ncbi:beta-lactamase family protein [Candidatus Kaiserbacteria bacterium]|nr:beta-lactamase family protein [Candidatus Kaiserbacteria bacterium]